MIQGPLTSTQTRLLGRIAINGKVSLTWAHGRDNKEIREMRELVTMGYVREDAMQAPFAGTFRYYPVTQGE